MPEPGTVTFAIVSDLHCRLGSDPRDSFLTVGQLRSPSGRHPIQSLLDVIDTEGIRADALLVPGDLTNRACIEGLQLGWNYAQEVGRKLGAPVISVIGNHDINSRRLGTEPVFHAVRNLHPAFPFEGTAEVQSFFADGYGLLNVAGSHLLAINSVIDQTDEISAKRGAFGADRIDRMERAVRDRMTGPIRGAMMHHHPTLHSGLFLEDTDVIPTGDALLAALGRLGCRFVIHGHKHFTRLTNIDGVAVFASGSFSAILYEFATAGCNTFHVLTVSGDQVENVRGQVKTWVFRYGSGWRRSSMEAGFPYLSGFGCRIPLTDVITGLKTLAASDAQKTRFLESEVLNAVPDAEYLTPDEKSRVNTALIGENLEISDHSQGLLELWRRFHP